MGLCPILVDYDLFILFFVFEALLITAWSDCGPRYIRRLASTISVAWRALLFRISCHKLYGTTTKLISEQMHSENYRTIIGINFYQQILSVKTSVIGIHL